MSKILEIRNPQDLEATYIQIEIERNTSNSAVGMANIATVNIDETTASDLSQGFTTYIDTAGDDDKWYRFRYKNGSTLSGYSDIFQANTSVMTSRFRRRMRDVNSANYFFTNDDIETMQGNAIKKLFPHTYNEVIDETLSTDGVTTKFGFPVGINRVNDIEFLDEQGHVVRYPRRWELRSRQIIFDTAPASGYTLRLYADKMFKKYAEVPDFLDDLILDLMRLEAYETFEASRSTYYKYTTVTNPEGANLPAIGNIITRLVVSTKQRLNEVRRTRRPGQIKLV